MKRLLWIIFVLSLIASLWSLYYGYFGDLVVNLWTGDMRNTANALIPCNMCRYIRVFMYPLPFITLIWLFFADYKVKYYIMTLSLIALVICWYKYGLELWRIPTSWDAFICVTSAADCAEAKPNYFWWVSMALLAGIANIILIFLACKISHPQNSPQNTVSL